ncbi:hypothetical protein GOBAR_AA33478 [Gossypium barbadense]|uniref:Uncharacterized protein n=1 Tax=Gossypium barbadense TaxID=3634 RepID=A0A2P5W806_GOSBA|nr:hypothetical protein GOBAR_AA33478 [Gossypium barbadense]
MDDAKKCEGRHRPRVAMDNFRKVMDDLALINIKPNKGWFTWTNNHDRDRVVRERLEKFLVSESEAKDMIKMVWNQCNGNMLTGIEYISLRLSRWQFRRFKRGQNCMLELIDRIDKLMDGPILNSNIERLRASQVELGCLYEEEERIGLKGHGFSGLRKGTEIPIFFYVWVSRRNKKNRIGGLNNSEGNWVSDVDGVCQVAWHYFHSLFKIEACGNLERALGLILICITSNMNMVLDSSVMDKELIDAFNQVDPCKASGINELSGLFYKEN